ncbi:hypothetical protein KP509_11G011600 [Ceratopteris richardii]|nr:hypothetical protein KP509_11G011600 [Ceratopteris richardii]
MSSLETLNLQHNNFSGSISPLLGGLSKLKSFNLSYNNLTGQIPRDGILRNFSAASFEGNAFLCGDPLVNITCSSPPPTTLVPVPSPPLPPLSSLKNDLLSRGSNNTWKVIIGVVVSVFALSMFIICMTIFVRRSRMKRARQVPNGLSSERGVANSSSKLEMYNRGFRFTYEEIVSHAGYYDTAHIVGKGRFATVYRSDLPGGIQMAVKVFKDTISRPAFEKEVETLESASHFDTLLPIRGYFSSAGEKAILYEFMPEGNLYDMLHNNPDAHVQLDWPIRINIAMGIAQALAHLHKGSSTRVLHKDVKSTNVLLNDKLSPFVADYGTVGLVSKSIVETPGYMAPELNVTKKYTEKTDVYGFGVVLVEILTGKKPVSYIGDRQLSLVNWTLRLHRSGRGREVFSSRLVETCPYPDYPDKALNLAVLCLHELPGQRPTMSEVASMLESLNAVHSPLKSPVFQHDRPLLQGS